jgi:hypothetical protein
MYVHVCVCVSLCVCIYIYMWHRHLQRLEAIIWPTVLPHKPPTGAWRRLRSRSCPASISTAQAWLFHSRYAKKKISKVVSIVLYILNVLEHYWKVQTAETSCSSQKKSLQNKILITIDMTALVLVWLTLVLVWLFQSRVPTAR